MGKLMYTPVKSVSVLDRRAATKSASLTGLERANLERVEQDELPPQPAEQQTEVEPVPAAPSVVAKSSDASAATGANAAHLYAGPGIMLKGEIVGCDTLRVEGVVDGNATARQLVICQGGRFLGTAQIEECEIEGSFEGTLAVRGHLVLRSSGRIAGTLSYGSIEVERGGEIVGEVTAQGKPPGAVTAKPVPQPVPPPQLVSVSNERRALAAAPMAEPEPVAEAPAQSVQEIPAAEPVAVAPAPQPVAQPAPRQPVQASPPPPVAETAAKARKSLFFGRG
jgi:cytoskeletal protein CcmA (bactofilin family)